MRLKKAIAVSVAVSVLMSMTLNVSAAQSSTDRSINQMKKSKQISLILDVDAYRAAYSDLEEAFGDNYDAYIRHYLTAGVYEGRKKGVLFDPLTYAEGYGDIKLAFGDDILAIVNHYVNFGVKENRKIGTAVGYEDIAAAMEDGAVRIAGRGESGSAVSGSLASSGTSGSQAVQKPLESQAPSGTSGSQAPSGTSGSQIPSGASGSQAEQKPSVNQTPSGVSGSQTEQKPSENQTPSGTSGNQGEDKFSSVSIGRMTYIYVDGDTLIRVEYYDENSKLIFYSDVVDYDSETKSYTEHIYSYDENNQCDVLVRTDIYVNGVLSSTTSGGQAEQKPSEGQTEQKPSENQTEDKFPGISIGRMTYIYADDNTLIRVEYYDENSKLIFYSDVVDYDRDTKSYTENIYSYDEENNCDVLVRTDIYVNGVLSSTK